MSDGERALRRQLEETREELRAVTDELAVANGELELAQRELGALREEFERASAEVASINASLTADTASAGAVGCAATVLEGLEMAAATLDPELVVRAWNGGAEALWGVPAAGVVGRTLHDLRTGPPADEVLALVATAVSGEGTASGEVKGADDQGRSVSYEVTCSRVLPGGAGAVAGMLVLARALDR